MRLAETEEELLHAGYRYALALTRHRQDAEDLVQQGWLRLHARYSAVAHRALLFTTIRNLFFDQLQRQARLQLVPITDLEESMSEVLPRTDPGTLLARVEIERLLPELRTKVREALVLHYVYGYTAAEIGEITSQPRGTVLSHLHRGKQKISGALAKKKRRP